MEKLNKNTQREQKLTPEEHQIAVSLETISSLEIKDIVFLVLIWRKLKTASAISFEGGTSEFNDLEKRLEKAGLFLKKTDRVVEGTTNGLKLGGNICFVANNQKDLDSIFELWFGDHDNDSRVYKEIGRMSGYPETAIGVYDQVAKLPEIERVGAREKLFLTEDEKVDLLKTEQDLIPFSFLFYMSKEHWKMEIETVSRWVEEMKLVARGTYNAFVTEFNKKHPDIQIRI